MHFVSTILYVYVLCAIENQFKKIKKKEKEIDRFRDLDVEESQNV